MTYKSEDPEDPGARMVPPAQDSRANPWRTDGGRVLPWRQSGDRRYDAAFEGALDRTVELEEGLRRQRERARQRGRRLLGQPATRRHLMVRNHDGYAGWWLAWLLLDEAEAMLPRRAVETERLADLAREALRRCAPVVPAAAAGDGGEARAPAEGAGDGPLVEDLRARSWRLAADARRLRGDLCTAGRYLARSQLHRWRGTGEPLERALWFESRGRLLAARGRRRRGERVLRVAARQFRSLRDAHLEGRARAALGLLLADGWVGAVASPRRLPDALVLRSVGLVRSSRRADAAPGLAVRAVAELSRARRLLDAGREPALARAVARRLRDLPPLDDDYAGLAVCAGAGLLPTSGPVLSPPA